MRLTITVFVLFALASCKSVCPPPLPTDDPITFHWGCPSFTPPLAPPPSIRVANQANGALSVLFDRGGIDLQPSSSELTARWATFLTFPVTTNATQPVSVTCQLRGFIAKSAPARASAYVDVDGDLSVLEFPAGQAIDRALEGPLSFTVAPSDRTFPITIVITASRPSAADAVRLDVDSVDCSITQPPS